MNAASFSTFSASFAQRRLWFIQQFAPGNAAYNMLVSLELPPGTLAPSIQHALDRLCAHHETLRTAFAVEDGDVVQRVASHAHIALQTHELPSRGDFRAIISARVAEPFVLDAAPLARAHVAYTRDAPPLLALVVHHIVADGVTLQILLGDLQALLHGMLQGQPVELPKAPVEYADYAVWQRRTLAGKRLQALADYWRTRLQGMPALALPGRRKGHATARGRVVALRIEPPVCDALRALAADAKATLFAVLLAGFCALLGRFSGQRDFGIGIPVSGRNRVELERVAGLFVNSVVFRATLPAGGSFADLVRHTAAALGEDLSRQEMPFEQVVDALRVKRSADRNPLFQVMLQLQRPSSPRATPETPRRTPPDLLDPEGLSAQLELSLMLFDTGRGGIEGGMVYAADLFDEAWVEQLAAAYRLLLEAAVHDPGQAFDHLPLLDEPAHRALFAMGQGAQRRWPPDTLLHEGLAEQARMRPDAVAVRAAGESLSFAALEQRAATLAARLLELGVRPGDTVALCAPRSAGAVAAMVATLKCGAAYLPMDTAAPAAYREGLLEDSSARVVVVAPGGRALACGLPALELGPGSVNSPAGRSPLPLPQLLPSATAYLIYTSGSTGKPKGVRIPHAAIVNHMRWMLERFHIGPQDRVLQRTPLSFDASVWEVWAPLWSGATLVLADTEGPFDPARLAQQVQAHAVTTLQVVPSLLRALLAQARAGELRSLRLLFCGGEVLTPELVRAAQAATVATVVNLYGPSETTIDATFHVCPAAPEGDACGDDVPIGRPIANVAAHVLDERLQPVPWGVAGELCIGGAAVGLGYQRRAALTAERFVDDPFTPGGRLFRSGDLARMDRDGTLHYLGRRDDQVKLRGFRIELGEIETRLAAHEAVAQAAAVVQHAAAGDDRLVAFASLRPGHKPVAGAELLAWLRAALPAHAVPSSLLLLDTLPRTAHGKIDRAALRTHAPVPSQAQAPGAGGTRTALEHCIAGCFERHLMLDHVGLDDDLFQIGGHSLLVIAVCADLTGLLGQPVNIVELFEFPTPRLLARALERRATPLQPSLALQAHAGGAP